MPRLVVPFLACMVISVCSVHSPVRLPAQRFLVRLSAESLSGRALQQCRGRTLRMVLPRFVYRTIRVSSEEHQRVLAGQSLTAPQPNAVCSVREHVLRGSGSKWCGSQFVSTTADLEVAVRFAAPCNPIIRIDLEAFARFGGDVVDLSSDAAFERIVPPAEADTGVAPDVLLRARATAKLGWTEPLGRYEDEALRTVSFKHARWLMEQAAATPWECSRMFASRSQELLLQGTIPYKCYTLLDYTVATTGMVYLPRHALPSFPPIANFCAWKPVGGANAGVTAFELPESSPCGGKKTFHLKQPQANTGPSMLNVSLMRESIDSEFAAWCLYRLVEMHCPEMEVNVRDCVKLTFDVSINGDGGCMSWSMKCLVFEHIETLEPVRVAWQMLPEDHCVTLLSPLPPALQRVPLTMKVTTEEVVARWRKKNATFTDADAVRETARIGPGLELRVFRHLPRDSALPALRGLAVDAWLANIYGWGAFDKPRLSTCTRSGKLYRMSAEAALGALGYGTEPLNDDRQETLANLGLNTFCAATANAPFFWQYGEQRPVTYEKAAGGPLFPAVEQQFVALRKFVAEHRSAVLGILLELPLPADARQVAALFPEEQGWILDVCSDFFWKSFVTDRLDLPLRRLRAAQSLSAMGDRRNAVAETWCGYNVGVLLPRTGEKAAARPSAVKPPPSEVTERPVEEEQFERGVSGDQVPYTLEDVRDQTDACLDTEEQ